MAGFGGGLAGLGPNFSFHEVAAWVDVAKPPGHTSTGPRTGQAGWWYSWPKVGVLGVGLPFVYSPNLVWFAVAAAVYALFPYDLPAAARWSGDFLAHRAKINLAVGMAWYGYWHVSLYSLGWGKRKFNSSSAGPSRSRLFHNVWYCFLGMLQWTAWEVIFVHLFASGKLAYMPDSQLLASWRNFAPTLFWTLAMPVFRDFHFYFAHRLIHVRSLYTYVHSLHHRNNDPEPFAGMCMHPVEHMYYLSCAALSLYVTASPFLVTWNLIHAVLAPAAGHSGYEDHWQSDQFHHLHHQYFECNYGNIGFPFDKWFGTIRHSIGDHSEYRGAAAPADPAKPATQPARPQVQQAYLRGSLSIGGALPVKPDHFRYWMFTATLPVVLYLAIARQRGGTPWPAWAVAAYLTLGPIIVAVALGMLGRDGRSPRWPFHKERVVGTFGCHLILCAIMVVVPTYQTIHVLFATQ